MTVETTFPHGRLADGLLSLTRATRWLGRGAALDTPPELPPGRDDESLTSLAARLKVEVEPVRLDHGELDRFLATTGPALLRPIGEPEHLVAIVRGGRRWCRIVGERGRRVRTEELRDSLTRGSRQAASEGLDSLLGRASMSPSQLEAARRALVDEHLMDQPAVEGWLLQPAPGARFIDQLGASGAAPRLATIVASHALSTILLIASWWVIGRGALEGHLDRGWLWAWALLLATTIPVRAAEQWSTGALAWRAGAVLKRRLLHGALRLEPDDVRRQGAGELLGRVVDSNRVEALAINGGLASLLACLELVLAGTVLASGAAPAVHLGLLAASIAVLSVATFAYLRRRGSWTRLRVGMTHRLVERLVGHRTRVAQEARDNWHDAEDSELEAYALESADLDRWPPRLQVLVPRGWLIAALLALMPLAVAGDLEPTSLAVSIGGALLAFRALALTVAGIAELGAAAIAWRNVRPLFAAATRSETVGSPAAQPEAANASDADNCLLEADGIAYRHAGRERDAVRDCSLEIFPRDRILLEGPSGGGKSTLIALFAALRLPHRGWLGLRGLDFDVWGADAWRRRVVCVPQFHENYLVTAPLAFNLLMGRGWPPTAQDLEEAADVCRELGLGPLLERMPAGLMQPVGDSGWQLSQGECTRVYLARALLQDAELVILDESLAGLDLDNLQRVLTCADRRAATLLVVAHP